METSREIVEEEEVANIQIEIIGNIEDDETKSENDFTDERYIPIKIVIGREIVENLEIFLINALTFQR